MSHLPQAIQLIRNGQKDVARELLKEVLRQDRDNEQAWLIMLSCVQTKSEYRSCLREILRINPENERALKLAEKHGILQEAIGDDSDRTFMSHDTMELANMRELLAEHLPQNPAPPVRQKKPDFLKLVGFMVVMMVLVGGIIVILTLSSLEDTPSQNTRQETEAVEIEATNQQLATDIFQQATHQAATLTAP